MTGLLPQTPELSDRDLAAIVRLVYERSGITLHGGKRALITARLQKRLKAGHFHGFREYVRHLQADPSGEEITAMVEAIATHHTSFFREAQHYDFLARTVLPRLQARNAGEPIRGWSAGCSTGEEPYSMAITAFERLGGEAPHLVRLLASDLSSGAVARAAAGVYRADRLVDLPRHLLLKYFDRDPQAPYTLVRVADHVRRLVEFRRLNLLEPWSAGPSFDFIFCRNVMIYFDRHVQQRVLDALEARLAPDGYLFTSHSESLNSLRHGLTWVAPSVYQRRLS